MCDNNELLARIEALERKFAEFQSRILLQMKTIVEFHDHTFGGRIVWEFPPELLAQIKAVANTVTKKHEENVTITDELKTELTPVG